MMVDESESRGEHPIIITTSWLISIVLSKIACEAAASMCRLVIAERYRQQARPANDQSDGHLFVLGPSSSCDEVSYLGLSIKREGGSAPV